MMGPVMTWMVSGFFVGWLVRVAMGSRRDFGILGQMQHEQIEVLRRIEAGLPGTGVMTRSPDARPA